MRTKAAIAAFASVVAFHAAGPVATSAGKKPASNRCEERGAVNARGLPCRLSADGSLRWGPRYRVMYYGDSLGVETARFARLLLARRGALMVNRTAVASAPCDWTAYIDYDLTRGTPDAVIVETLGNFRSRCQLPPSGRRPKRNGAAYWRFYGKDLLRLASRFPESTGVWMSPAPPTRNDGSTGFSPKARMLSVMREVASSRANTFALDAGALIEERGSFRRFAPCLDWEPVCLDTPFRGMTILRALDGVHFCPSALRATARQLQTCDPNPGAYRFAFAQVNAVAAWLSANR